MYKVFFLHYFHQHYTHITIKKKKNNDRELTCDNSHTHIKLLTNIIYLK